MSLFRGGDDDEDGDDPFTAMGVPHEPAKPAAPAAATGPISGVLKFTQFSSGYDNDDEPATVTPTASPTATPAAASAALEAEWSAICDTAHRFETVHSGAVRKLRDFNASKLNAGADDAGLDISGFRALAKDADSGSHALRTALWNAMTAHVKPAPPPLPINVLAAVCEPITGDAKSGGGVQTVDAKFHATPDVTIAVYVANALLPGLSIQLIGGSAGFTPLTLPRADRPTDRAYQTAKEIADFLRARDTARAQSDRWAAEESHPDEREPDPNEPENRRRALFKPLSYYQFPNLPAGDYTLRLTYAPGKTDLMCFELFLCACVCGVNRTSYDRSLLTFRERYTNTHRAVLTRRYNARLTSLLNRVRALRCEWLCSESEATVRRCTGSVGWYSAVAPHEAKAYVRPAIELFVPIPELADLILSYLAPAPAAATASPVMKPAKFAALPPAAAIPASGAGAVALPAEFVSTYFSPSSPYYRVGARTGIPFVVIVANYRRQREGDWYGRHDGSSLILVKLYANGRAFRVSHTTHMTKNDGDAHRRSTEVGSYTVVSAPAAAAAAASAARTDTSIGSKLKSAVASLFSSAEPDAGLPPAEAAKPKAEVWGTKSEWNVTLSLVTLDSGTTYPYRERWMGVPPKSDEREPYTIDTRQLTPSVLKPFVPTAAPATAANGDDDDAFEAPREAKSKSAKKPAAAALDAHSILLTPAPPNAGRRRSYYDEDSDDDDKAGDRTMGSPAAARAFAEDEYLEHDLPPAVAEEAPKFTSHVFERAAFYILPKDAATARATSGHVAPAAPPDCLRLLAAGECGVESFHPVAFRASLYVPLSAPLNPSGEWLPPSLTAWNEPSLRWYSVGRYRIPAPALAAAAAATSTATSVVPTARK